MRVLRAEHLGLCFGVRDALAAARGIERPAQVTVFGQLVHNPLVVDELSRRGFQLADESVRECATPATDQVLITAHGISNRQRAMFESQGKRLIDTTCPLVKKAHNAALELAREGRLVLIIGKRGHVEVRGLTGDLAWFEVIESIHEVRQFASAWLGIIAQTTSIGRDVLVIVARIRELNRHADIRVINTVCQPTRDRQAALEELLKEVDVLVVVGGHGSNNTRQLVARAKESHVPALHVEQAAELDESLFHERDIVGLTAGTSTLPETVDAVEQRLASFHSSTHRPLPAMT